MNDFLPKQLLVNYLLGICTPREEEEVERWLEKKRDHSSYLLQIAKELAPEHPVPLPEKSEVKQALFREMKPKNLRMIAAPEASHVPPHLLHKRSGFWFKATALLLVALLAGFVALWFENQKPEEMFTGPVFQQSTLSYGQTATLQFGDGTVVRLNGGSTLRYPEAFAQDQREVYLEGEAFFEVASDETRPFFVHAGGTQTRVLGTSFNIKAYEYDDEIQVAVAEGAVAVTRRGRDHEPDSDEIETILLEKNQWLTVRSEGRILEKGEGDIREMIAWKDRILLFSNKTFEEVVDMLERWYGVEIVLEEPALKSMILEGEHLDVSLEEVLNSLQLAMDFEYVLDGNKVRIY